MYTLYTDTQSQTYTVHVHVHTDAQTQTDISHIHTLILQARLLEDLARLQIQVLEH